jgi:hypothetical protein
MFNDIVVGKCSLCGGSVTVPTVWHGILRPTATCQSCGATEKNNLPVIQMEKPAKRNVTTITVGKTFGTADVDSEWKITTGSSINIFTKNIYD